MSCHTCVRLVVGCAYLIALATVSGAATITEDFSTDPSTRGWVGVGNTTAPNNYGWSSTTNHAGGGIGEAGGTFQARVGGGGIMGYWDSTLGGNLTQSQALTATGLFTITNLSDGPFDGGFDFGFLNVTSPTAVALSGGHAGGYAPMVGFRFNDNNPSTTEYRVNAQMAFGTATSERTQSGLLVLTAGVDYKFTIAYDPNGGGVDMGVTTLTVNLASDDSLVGSVSTGAISSAGAPIALDAFGFSGLTYPANLTTADIFVDNLEYTAVPEPTGILLAMIGLTLGAVSRISNLIGSRSNRVR